MKKRLFTLLLAISMVVSTLSVSVFATQSRTDYFSRNYKLSGSQAKDMVAVAKAQIGKTQKNLKYTEAWCADFVCDVAKLAKVSDKVIAHNYNGRGSCTYLYNYMVKNCGAKRVSDRKAGDLVFYYCTKCGRYVHVGIVEDSKYSIEGNLSSQVKRTSSYTDSNRHTASSGVVKRHYLRPKYTSVSTKPVTTPSLTVSPSKVSVQVGKTTQLSCKVTPSGNKVTWSTSNSKIATVNSSGKVTGVKAGTATITAKSSSGKTAKCTVTVTKKVSYFPKCNSKYTSIVDALKSIGADSSYAYRKKIAAANGISNYTGTASQNTKMLSLLKSGKLIKP